MKHNQDNKDIVSVWGKISRRELFERMAGVSLAFGLTAFETAQAQTANKKSDIIQAPYNDLTGQPFREFTPPEGSARDLFKNTPAKGGGKKPRIRRRDSFWPENPNERFVASTEILESTFGKLKRIERQQSQDGMTGLMLIVGAMVGTRTETDLREALDATPQKKVDNWVDRALGHSMQWFRRQFFSETKA